MSRNAPGLVALLLACAMPLVGQEKEDFIRFQLDQAYAEEYGVEIPFKITFQVPRVYQLFVQYPPHTDGSLIRVNLTTPERRLIESFQLTNMTIPNMGGDEDRLIVIAGLLATDGIQLAFAGRRDARIVNLRNLSTDRLLAVAIDGSMVTQDGTALFVSLTGIVPRAGERGLVAVSFIDPQVSEVKTAADIPRAGVIRQILASLRLEGFDGSGPAE